MPVPIDDLLRGLQKDLTPSRGVKLRIQAQITKKTSSGLLFREVREALAPNQSTEQRVWARILSTISVNHTIALLGRIRDFLTPSAELSAQIRKSFAIRLVSREASPMQWSLKWIAAFAVFAILVRMVPQFFLAPSTVAESTVTLLPTSGSVSIAVSGLWQPVETELTLERNMLLRTEDGTASIVFHDDGVIRLSPQTTIEILDVTDRKEPSIDPTFRLLSGQIWVQGLTPSYLRPLEIVTDNANVIVHEGSFSIADYENTDITVWDRRVSVRSQNEDLSLVSGERVSIPLAGELVVKKVPIDQFQSEYVAENLKRDAVHRRAIAQLQQERSTANAGILPTSRLYPVKRIAESMEVLLTFNEEAQVKKRLELASVRLDEAAGLLAQGEGIDVVQVTLDDYRQSLLAVATGSGDQLSQFLIDEAIANQSDKVAALLPDEEAYLIKQAVLEASAEVPDGKVSAADVQGVLLVDATSALLRQVDEGDIASIETIWGDIQGHLTLLEGTGSSVRPEVVKEARELLSEFAFAVNENAEDSEIDETLLEEIRAYLPPETAAGTPVLSEEQILQTAQEIEDRVFLFHMAQSRINQLLVEFKALVGNPDQGSILRRLYFSIPDGPDNLPELVRKEIVRLQWEKAGTNL